MSYPTEADAAIIKVGDGATPEIFTIVCGIENVTLNETANTSDRFRRDCAKPGAIPRRAVKVNGLQWDVTGSGVTNTAQNPTVRPLLGAHKNYKIDFIQYDGTDEGNLLGTYAGQGVLTARNANVQTSGDSTSEITIAGENDLIWTAAS